MRCNLLDEQMILLSLFGNGALYLIQPHTAPIYSPSCSGLHDAVAIGNSHSCIYNNSQYLDLDSTSSYLLLGHNVQFFCCS